jgi:hypothetical protein
MKSLYLVVLFFLGFCGVYSQPTDCACPNDEDYVIRLQEGLMGFEYRNPVEGYTGQQYFNNWVLGEVRLKNGDVIRNIFLRYDIYMDELLWLRHSDLKTGILNKADVAGFILSENRNEPSATFIKKNITLPFIGSKDSYLQVLVTGDPALYAYRNATTTSTDYRLIENGKYLISLAGKNYFVKLTKKSLLDIPVIPETEMKAIIRSNRIAIKNNEYELIRAVSLYNLAHK